MPRTIRPRSIACTMVAAAVVATAVLVAASPASALAPTIRTTGALKVPIGYPAPIESSAGLPLLINDSDSVRMQVTITAQGVTSGTALEVTLAGTTGLTFSAGDGTADTQVSFSGLRTDVNAALDGATVRARATTSGQSLLVVADDNPGTGVGATDTETVTVTVTDVDPVLTVPAFIGIGSGATKPVGLPSTLSVSDADSPEITVQASLVPGNPTTPHLSVPAIAGLDGSGKTDVLGVDLTGPPALVEQGMWAMTIRGGTVALTTELRWRVTDTKTDIKNTVTATTAVTATDADPIVHLFDATIGVGGPTPVTGTISDTDSPLLEVELSTSQSGVPANATPRIVVGTTTGLELRSGSFTQGGGVTFVGSPNQVGLALSSVELTGGAKGTATYRVEIDDDPSASTSNNVASDEATITVITAPSAPTNVAAAASGDDTRLTFTAPTSSGDEAIAGYRVYRTVGGVTTSTGSFDGTATSLSFPTQGFGTAQQWSVAAMTTSGAVGPRSALSNTITPQRFHPYASVDAMVTGLYADLLGRAPTAAERSATASLITTGTRPSNAIAPIRATSESQSTVDAVTRLYRAYFLRIPDAGGLKFWLGRKRGGTKLDAISQSFATSSEFTTRYGSLTNRQFVELIYQNLFGRTGDAAGVAFWTGQLDAGKKNRGSVMAGFSESSEYKRKQVGAVEVSALYILMLGRAPTQAEFDAAVPIAEASPSTFHSTVLSSPLLDARVP